MCLLVLHCSYNVAMGGQVTVYHAVDCSHGSETMRKHHNWQSSFRVLGIQYRCIVHSRHIERS